MHPKQQELLQAAQTGDIECVLSILEHIYEHNCHDESLLQASMAHIFSIRDSDDGTLLLIASERGHSSVVDAFLRHGFPVDTLSKGSTALHRAVEGDHFSCMKLLLLFGSAILPNTEGKTPIDIAREMKYETITNFFDTYPRTRKGNVADPTADIFIPLASAKHKKRLIVGVSGATCSGKSTLTRSLVKHFECTEPFHHMDRYWKEFHQFPREKGFVIGETPDCLRIDLFTDDLRKRQHGNDPILFVDGFLLLHSPDVRELLDLKIFLQITETECRQRRKARNPGTSKPYHDKVIWPSYLEYNGKYATQPVGLMGDDTLIMDGSKPMEDVLREAILFIEQNAKKKC